MSLLQEFKKFALKGSMVDMAIGLVIGAAFTGVVNSLVSDLIMPPFGVILGGLDFTDFSITLVGGEDPVVWAYGAFLTELINFLVVAMTIFLVIKGMNRLRRKSEAEQEVESPHCPECLMEVPSGAHRCCHCGVSLST